MTQRGRGPQVAARVVVHVSPHPDDEVLGAGAALTALCDAGWDVVNLACGLGRPADWSRRATELEKSLSVLGFSGRTVDPPILLSRSDDLEAATGRVTQECLAAVRTTGASLVVSPQTDDGHHGHVAVARGVAAAVAQVEGITWWSWGLWADIREPTLYVPYGEDRMAQLLAALSVYEGELARNRYQDLLPARARAAAILGSERVFGFGSGACSPLPYADLLIEQLRRDGRWVHGSPRLLDPSDPLPA